MDKLTLTTKITLDEYYDYNKKILLKNRFSFKKDLRISFIILIVVLAFFYYIGITDLIYYIQGILILTVFFFIRLGIDLIYCKKDCAKILRFNNILNQEKKNIITEKGISCFYKGGEDFNEWSCFETIHETSSAFMLNAKPKYSFTIFLSKSSFEYLEDLKFFRKCTDGIDYIKI